MILLFKRFTRKLAIATAIIINAVERALFYNVNNETKTESTNQGIEIVNMTYYFLVRATRFNTTETTTITIPVQIVVDGWQYTKQDAEAFAKKSFQDLDDRWKIKATPMTKEHFDLNRGKWLDELGLFDAPTTAKEIPNS